MTHDPIVDEVRNTRERLLARFDGDLDKLFEFLKSQESAHADRLVSPRRPAGTAQASPGGNEPS
jgi:hypothetical protein